MTRKQANPLSIIESQLETNGTEPEPFAAPDVERLTEGERAFFDHAMARFQAAQRRFQVAQTEFQAAQAEFQQAEGALSTVGQVICRNHAMDGAQILADGTILRNPAPAG